MSSSLPEITRALLEEIYKEFISTNETMEKVLKEKDLEKSRVTVGKIKEIYTKIVEVLGEREFNKLTRLNQLVVTDLKSKLESQIKYYSEFFSRITEPVVKAITSGAQA